MTTFLTTVRMTLAVLSISLGATVALATDKKPSKPAKPNAPAAVQKTNAPAIKSPRDVASGQATGRTQQPLPPKSILNTQVTSYNFMSPRQAMPNGTPNGRTKASNLGDLDARSPTPQLAYIIDPGMAKAAPKSPTSK